MSTYCSKEKSIDPASSEQKPPFSLFAEKGSPPAVKGMSWTPAIVGRPQAVVMVRCDDSLRGQGLL
jgi:hypothetical protein